MKIEHFMIIFAAILVGGLLLVSTTTNITTTANEQTLNYREFVDTAVEGAMDAALQNVDELLLEDGNLWSENRIQITSDTFYNALSQNFGYPIGIGQEDFYYKIPIMAFIDNDGFYVHYINKTEDSNGVYSYEKVLSDKHQWIITDQYNNQVMLTMYDLVQITDVDGNIYSDSFQNAFLYFSEKYEDMDKPEWLIAMETKEGYQKYKNLIMIDKMENNFNYYLNLDNHVYNQIGRSYCIQLDYEDSATKATISKPGFMTFFQGPVVKNHKDYISIYTMACRTIDTDMLIPVTYDENQKRLIYHDTRKCNIPNDDNVIATYNDSASAAASGAYPCDCWFSTKRKTP